MNKDELLAQALQEYQAARVAAMEKAGPQAEARTEGPVSAHPGGPGAAENSAPSPGAGLQRRRCLSCSC